LRDPPCPQLAGGALPRIATGQIGLDEVARHSLDARAAAALRIGKNVVTLSGRLATSAERARELRARAHPELRVHTREVSCNGPLTEEQLCCNFTARVAR